LWHLDSPQYGLVLSGTFISWLGAMSLFTLVKLGATRSYPVRTPATSG
jgi:hypothetical protein